MEALRKEYEVSEEYASGIINFSVSLGLLERVGLGGTLQRLSLSNLGRAYRAARKTGSLELRNFIVTYALLEYDSDVYGLLLDILIDSDSDKEENLKTAFLRRTKELRSARQEWILRSFPQSQLRERICEHVQWIRGSTRSQIRVKSVGEDFARHHVTPRKDWARWLGHLDGGKITAIGRDLVERLRSDRDRYFWLGPSKECLKTLRINSNVSGPFAPAWNLFRPNQPAVEPPGELVSEIAIFMKDAFPTLRLVQANQAPLEAVLPFVYLKEYQLNIRVEPDRLFEQLFADNRDVFAPMLKRTGRFGHYQLRRHA
ncbi:hypothetical protein MJD09_24330 [bacterium]|nr:hypothetical protein [bacterium]